MKTLCFETDDGLRVEVIIDPQRENYEISIRLGRSDQSSGEELLEVPDET